MSLRPIKRLINRSQPSKAQASTYAVLSGLATRPTSTRFSSSTTFAMIARKTTSLGSRGIRTAELRPSRMFSPEPWSMATALETRVLSQQATSNG